jgi:uncharacterized cupredoxin-like copper-binding protein
MKVLSAVIVLTALFGAACTSSKSSAKGATTVVATDDACKPAKTSFPAGKLTFEVQNKGSQVTEMYVYAAHDKVIGEVENVGPGTSRQLTVDIKAGDGIRAPITVTGEGGSESAGDPKAARDVEVVAQDYKFLGLENFSTKVGESDNFELFNKGTVKHELEIKGPDGKTVGEVEPVDPGKNGEAVITFKQSGTYTYVCGIEDHEARGMKGTFTVS